MLLRYFTSHQKDIINGFRIPVALTKIATLMTTPEDAQSPAQLGYHMPAEWEPQHSIYIGWPDRPDNWKNNAVPAQQAFVRVATAISLFEPVVVCAKPDQVENAQSKLPFDVEVIPVPQDDCWFRDIGPTFVVNKATKQLGGIDWEFNAWGGYEDGIYPNWEQDNAAASLLITQAKAQRFKCSTILEGGSIHVDGLGTLLTTEECLLHPSRNPDMNKSDIESSLQEMLGVSKFIWLPRGLYGDTDTNGHIDNFACFAKPGLVLLAWTDDETDPQYEISKEALDILNEATDARGEKIEVVKVPLPPPMYYTEEDVEGLVNEGAKARHVGERLAASYINFLIVNDGVIMPGFGDKESDERAKKVLEQVFPDRKVLQVQTRDIVLGGGNIHCITQQRPLATV